MGHTARSSIVAALTSLLVVASCSDNATEPGGGDAVLNVSADLSATAVTLVVVEVTGPGIATPLVFNIPVSNGVATGSITIPAGADRLISGRAYDAGGVETHNGSTTVDVAAGTNTGLTLLLTPLTGALPIEIIFGDVTVTVTPQSPQVVVGSTVALVATIMVDGITVTDSPTWATSDPGIATVSSAGVVTGAAVGIVNVVATFRGVAGSTSVTVSAAP